MSEIKKAQIVGIELGERIRKGTGDIRSLTNSRVVRSFQFGIQGISTRQILWRVKSAQKSRA